jgi:hypothetical protein
VYNRIVVAPGFPLGLGAEGGELILQPPGFQPGAVSFSNMQNKVWHLLREDGPDTGFPAPTSGDFSATIVQRDLNIYLGMFVSDTGLAPGLCDRMLEFPVFALLDYPVPPDLVSLTGIEYNPYGQDTYNLTGYGLEEWKIATGNIVDQSTGQPYYYREPFAGYVRLYPQPSAGNASGPAAGTIGMYGTPLVGQVFTLMISSGGPLVAVSYTTLATDTLNSIVQNWATAINQSAAVQGTSAFLSPATYTINPGYGTVVPPAPLTNVPQVTVNLNASNFGPVGEGITFYVTTSGPVNTALGVTPSSPTAFVATGDTMTWYYSALGTFMQNPGDNPGIPPQFHMAPVYRCLADYWARKETTLTTSDKWMKRYEEQVKRAKAFTFDSNRSTQDTIAGDDYSDAPLIGGGFGP